jgi:AhpD family alkylhydroperoxidase
MGRIPAVPVERAGVVGRAVYRYLLRRFGAVPEPISVLRWHPRLFWAFLVSEEAYHRAARTLPKSVRELAVYRVATNVGCSWCVDFGTMVQRRRGLDVDRLADIDNYPTSPRFSPDERLALEYADAVSARPMAVTDELVARVVDRFGRDGAVELTHAIALEEQRATFNHALGLVDQGFTSGEACRVPMPRADQAGAPPAGQAGADR